MNLHILFEDDDILVCEKPAGMPTQSDKTMAMDLENALKNYIHEKTKKTPYIGLIHRLDRPVGGIMVFAKTPQATKDLNEQIRLKKMTKRYLAVITGPVSEEAKTGEVLLTDYLAKDGRTNLSKVSTEKDRNAKKAELRYQVRKTVKKEELSLLDGAPFQNTDVTLVEIELLTGRHHQIRVQFASRGNALWGDTKYNPFFLNDKTASAYLKDPGSRDWNQIALYSYQLSFVHPKTKKPMEFESLPQSELFQFLLGK